MMGWMKRPQFNLRWMLIAVAICAGIFAIRNAERRLKIEQLKTEMEENYRLYDRREKKERQQELKDLMDQKF
jgi:hypothetical protein